MVTNVTSLLKTVKTVEDEAARGTRALESTIEAIGQEIKVIQIVYFPIHLFSPSSADIVLFDIFFHSRTRLEPCQRGKQQQKI